jgi:hypothetical protein
MPADESTSPTGQPDVSPEEARDAVQQQQGSAPPGVVQPCVVLTWVEFCLVDMEGNPVSGQRYKLKLPDGSVKEGTLGKSGCVRVDNINPGTATISYLDLDEEAWERI